MSLWNIATVVLGAFLLNSTFFIIPYLMPRVNAIELLTFQAFGNGLLLLLVILPRRNWSPKDLVHTVKPPHIRSKL